MRKRSRQQRRARQSRDIFVKGVDAFFATSRTPGNLAAASPGSTRLQTTRPSSMKRLTSGVAAQTFTIRNRVTNWRQTDGALPKVPTVPQLRLNGRLLRDRSHPTTPRSVAMLSRLGGITDSLRPGPRDS